ncbi:MAG: YlmH/Sll1252 family protein [Gudongella sp.]|jgi:RNA-binding protein YlmH|nr:YlmH/Sll1252 family protein [Gudongella sp.]
MERQSITSYIQDSDVRIKIERILERVETAGNRHIVTDSDFLDPYERETVIAAMKWFPDTSCFEDGAPENGERKVLVFFPSYKDYVDIESRACYLRIDGDLSNLSHKDFLGSIMSLGIKREKLGDIYVYDDHVKLAAKSEISEYILLNLEKVGRRKVKVQTANFSEFVVPNQQYIEKTLFISSERLDVYLCAAYGLSRNECNEKIASDDVKVNWKSIKKSGFELRPGDIVSLKGYGRSEYTEKLNFSKKGRLRIKIKIFK